MHKRTIIIFTIFVAIAILGSGFIYFYRDFIDQAVKTYISKITVCGNITDDEVCMEKDFCQGIYGPSCPDCTDLVFRECVRAPEDSVAVSKKGQELCEQTGGQWYSNRLGDFCLCNIASPNSVFNKEIGCTTEN